jgi:hypothetical protein
MRSDQSDNYKGLSEHMFVWKKTTVLIKMKKTYQHLDVDVEPLQIDSQALNTKRILDLMAVKSEDGSVPLYVHTVTRILREMRMSQQATGTRFDYETFKSKILAAELAPTQLAPLSQRLAMLESFMPETGKRKKGKIGQDARGTTWENEVRNLSIITNDTTDIIIARVVNNSRSLMPLRYTRDGLLIV